MKPLIAVTGKNGQLGTAIADICAQYSQDFDFAFTGKEELDISHEQHILSFFEERRPSYFIHCAAYAAVDKAETDKGTAYQVNAEAPGMIATQCKKHNCTLITISTDYVFDGNGTHPYRPEDITNPVNYYGHTKREGELLAMQNNPKTIVIRTSWVYSRHGHNFVKTMLRLMKERKEIAVVNDQIGSPTYAFDLAQAILKMVSESESGNKHYGIYHFSNTGVISWYEFALAIRDIAGLDCDIKPVPTSAYPTAAKRPAYSVMDISAIQKDFLVIAPEWKISLAACLDKL